MMKKILFLAAVVFLGLGFSFQAKATPSVGCPGVEECFTDSNCPSGYVCGNELVQPCAGVKGIVQICVASNTTTNSSDPCVGKPDNTECFYKGDSSKKGSCVKGVCWYLDATITSTQITSLITCTVGQPCNLSSGAGTCQNAVGNFASAGYKTVCVLNGYDASGNAVTTNSSTGTTGATGGDNCSGGCQDSCALSGLNVSSNVTEFCSDSSQQCCVERGSGSTTNNNTNATSTGVLANQDNCPGGCQDSCTIAGLGVSTNQAEYCADSGQQCCAGFGSGGTTNNDTATAAGSGCPDSNFEKINGVCFPATTGLSESTIKDIIESILAWLLGIFGVLGILVFVISGIFYFTAAGDADQEKKAKNAMMMGIMGVVVGLAGFVVIKAIDMALNASQRF